MKIPDYIRAVALWPLVRPIRVSVQVGKFRLENLKLYKRTTHHSHKKPANRWEQWDRWPNS